jgi:hypothetical protein
MIADQGGDGPGQRNFHNLGRAYETALSNSGGGNASCLPCPGAHIYLFLPQQLETKGTGKTPMSSWPGIHSWLQVESDITERKS